MLPPPPSDPILTDRTTIETDWTCGMKRWWYKEEGGVGIVPLEEAVWFQQGRDYHEDFALIAESDRVEGLAKDLVAAIEDKISKTDDQPTQEALCRRAGWIAANALYFEPLTRRDYEHVKVEHELVLQRDPLWVVVTPDRILSRRSDSRLVYRDYKGVGGWGITSNWLASWPYQVQMHTVLKAIEEEFGMGYPMSTQPPFGQIIGLSKGQDRDGRLHHPYVWAYSNEGRTDWATEWAVARKKGLTPAPVWEYSGGIFEWVRTLGEGVMAEQFAFSAPIYLNERLLSDLIESRTRRERIVGRVRSACQTDRRLRMIHFEPRFSECRPTVGTPCSYLLACHNAAVNEDPLGSGLYVKRTPHHELERIEKGFDEQNT